MTGRNWGDTLIESHPTSGEPVAALAESWSASPDAKVWTFKIRKGVQFHDGKELTVDDVVATLKRHSDENSQSGALGIMNSISDVKADGGDLVVSLPEGNADLPPLLSDYHLRLHPNRGADETKPRLAPGPHNTASFHTALARP